MRGTASPAKVQCLAVTRLDGVFDAAARGGRRRLWLS
jgi:hypothetical protein